MAWHYEKWLMKQQMHTQKRPIMQQNKTGDHLLNEPLTDQLESLQGTPAPVLVGMAHTVVAAHVSRTEDQ